MPQTDYSLFMPIGQEGQLATGQHFRDIRGTYSELVNGSTVRIPFGRVVVRKPGGQTGELQLPSATGQTIEGVSYFSNTWEKDENGNAGYPPKAEMAVVKKTVIFMVAEEALAVTDTLYFRHTLNGTPGTYEALGRIRNDADTAKCDVFTGAKLVRACSAGEVVPVEVFITT